VTRRPVQPPWQPFDFRGFLVFSTGWLVHSQAIRVAGSGSASDLLEVAARPDPLRLLAVENSTQRALAHAGLTREDVDIFELHDAYTIMVRDVLSRPLWFLLLYTQFGSCWHGRFASCWHGRFVSCWYGQFALAVVLPNFVPVFVINFSSVAWPGLRRPLFQLVVGTCLNFNHRSSPQTAQLTEFFDDPSEFDRRMPTLHADDTCPR
jgi:hypothetical protein